MKKLTYISAALLLMNISKMFGQSPISSFYFTSYPLTTAAAGPNATYINPAAATDGTGIYLTTSGPSVGIDLRIPGSAFDVESITLSFDYIRRENEATFFRRDGLIISMDAGRIRVQYQTYNTAWNTGTVTYDFVDVYTVPNLTRFTLGFTYDRATGIAALYNNTTQVWSYDGTNNRALRFSGGNAFVGELMDGTGSTSPTLFGFHAFPVANVTLPVSLLSFDAKPLDASSVYIGWTTASEINNAFFSIEHSRNGKDWKSIGEVKGSGNTNYNVSYEFIHKNPVNGKNYYRLRQTDFDGKTEVFSPVVVEISKDYEDISIYPNPVVGNTFEILIPQENFTGTVKIYSIDGRLLYDKPLNNSFIVLDRSNLPVKKGIIYVVYDDFSGNKVSKAVVLN